jgi:hypothetical protein
MKLCIGRLEMDQQGGAGGQAWVNVLIFAWLMHFFPPAVFFLLRQSGIY